MLILSAAGYLLHLRFKIIPMRTYTTQSHTIARLNNQKPPGRSSVSKLVPHDPSENCSSDQVTPELSQHQSCQSGKEPQKKSLALYESHKNNVHKYTTFKIITEREMMLNPENQNSF